ncbi:sigma-70 family RNA polymerase sigma factor [Spongisporangium articulatum]|uniref:Sigma-70 family RNA polymerase sigma factor n=1 Tax=Spongisporangium articulatum TaxID=3362603 RepID=A0ABW8AMR4_9ACTN
MSDDELAARFEAERARLQAVAYRMLGSPAEAEDAVQETWFRLARSDHRSIDNLAAWLTTVVGRVCLDGLRARKARREAYVGTWLPDAVIADVESAQPGPDRDAELADAVGTALLVVLETLTPGERLAFLLHDMFGLPFGEIARVLDTSVPAARQLASRGRRRVRGAPEPERDRAAQREVVEAFLAAARRGDFDALVEVLHPDAVFRIDPGASPGGRGAPAEVNGSAAVARQAAANGPFFAPTCRVALINGSVGIVVGAASGAASGTGPGTGRPRGAAAVTVVDGVVVAIDLVLAPEKLHVVS